MSTQTEPSFVQTEMRAVAMKLHTRDQAKEGEQKAKTPISQWAPQVADYLQFLVDSREVYQTMEDICNSYSALEPFRNTGLERTAPLTTDIDWMTKAYKLDQPEVGELGRNYANVLKNVAEESTPGFICHYYNHYFAHTAGGRMIGKKMADLLLEGRTLEFYKWDGDVIQMGEAVRIDIDKMAATWSEAEKKECLDETANTFRYGGSLLGYLSGTAKQ
eukprot:CAMPEP_0117752118 /NCGR_PEP_ID=MMETSP0947-20121206/11414_1 /TAXON_ID=44440 /ORGANISM="Chattonella subsalsa, Strain CCMP2191" /LENGTH=217 /DNA_ID=CAMNT_0005570697 /DNA_START=220 /DNA_END=873 /DNA_ORIENTATION=+